MSLLSWFEHYQIEYNNKSSKNKSNFVTSSRMITYVELSIFNSVSRLIFFCVQFLFRQFNIKSDLSLQPLPNNDHLPTATNIGVMRVVVVHRFPSLFAVDMFSHLVARQIVEIQILLISRRQFCKRTDPFWTANLEFADKKSIFVWKIVILEHFSNVNKRIRIHRLKISK